MALAPIIIPALVKQTATIIFLHGLGDTGHGWSEAMADLKPDYAKLICPTAPIRAVTANDGAKMPAWYDIISFSKKGEDQASIQDSADAIQSMIQKEVDSGIPAARIVLGGFSQGAAISLYTGLTGKHAVAGVVAMSGYLPLYNLIKWDSVKTPKILQCHGDKDHIVSYQTAVTTKKRFEEHNYPYFEFKNYPGMDHSACETELRDIKEFFHKVLGNVTARSEL